MKILIVEDDFISGKFLHKFMSQYGECDIVLDGLEALDAYLVSIKSDKPYNLICLDIMMPRVDGIKVLKAIRDLETQKGILPANRAKVIITTALSGSDFAQKAFDIGCEGFIEKPIEIEKLAEVIDRLDIKSK